MNAAIDVRSVLPTIRVPTLVIHRTDDARIKFAGGRYLADKIPNAQFVELPGCDHPIWTGDVDSVVDEIEAFLTGARPAAAADRVLATILIARLVPPGRHAKSEKLDRLGAAATESIGRFGGQAAHIGAGEFSARFDGPARAVRCAMNLSEAARTIGFDLAAGVHTGEIEVRENIAAGLAVHATERICAHAAAGEVLVSGVVTDLVAGSGLHFAERGVEPIEGFDHGLRLFAALEGRAPARETVAPSLDLLSPREREVLGLVAEGLSNAAIAKRIFLSEHTVKRHVANILVKLDLPTRAAAAALAGRHRPA
jgi:DNA-binding CsgD family transcriptional regulator